MPDKIIIQLIPIITAAIKSAPYAIEWLDKISSAIKNGVTEAELLVMVSEAHQDLDNLIEMTKPDETPPAA